MAPIIIENQRQELRHEIDKFVESVDGLKNQKQESLIPRLQTRVSAYRFAQQLLDLVTFARNKKLRFVTIIEIVLLIVAGLMVGFINTLAGGGSIISLSVLMMLGLPATLANGTNRVAIAIQSMTAVTSFSAQKVMVFRKGLFLAIPTVVGSVLGAYIAVDINEEIFEYAVAVIMLAMLFFILYKPQHWLKEQTHLINRKLSAGQIVLFFLIGLYGGFIHVGVGYFLLAAIVLSAGYELVKANAIKVLIIMLYTPFALVVFILNDQVNWRYGLVMTIGNVAGAYIASHMAVKQGANFVRWVIVVVILLTSAHLFGIIDIKAIVESIKT